MGMDFGRRRNATPTPGNTKTPGRKTRSLGLIKNKKNGGAKSGAREGFGNRTDSSQRPIFSFYNLKTRLEESSTPRGVLTNLYIPEEKEESLSVCFDHPKIVHDEGNLKINSETS